jgi:4-hydroxy-tetrahydrodipicolinate synthase
VVGVSAPGFAAMGALAKAAMDVGAAGVMIAPPPSLKTDDQIVAYYANAAEAIGRDVPFVVQDYPYASGVVFAPGVIRRIVTDNPSCVMLKHEDWPGLDKLSAVRRFITEGSMRPVSILCGNGGLFLPQELERGADGAMTGYAFPEMLVALVQRIKAGERAAAHDLFDLHLPLLRYEQQPGFGLAVRKYVLKRRGAIASDAQRKPASKLSPDSIAEIEWMLDRMVEKGGVSLRGPAAADRAA